MSAAGVSVIVLAYNEARQIADCLETLRWADELIVIDSGSTDGTVEIARRYAHRVEVWAPYPGYARQRNRSLELASHDWIFCVDADERCPPGLAREIRRVVAAPQADCYNVASRNYVFGRWMRSERWWPQYHVRLFRKGAARWEEREVHPHVITTGRVSRLEEPLDHYPYPDLSTCWEKMQRYTSWEARQRLKQGGRLPAWRLVISCAKPGVQFWRDFVTRRGFLDGWTGFFVALLFSPYSLLADWHTWCGSRGHRP